MDTSSNPENQVERLRADLDTIRSAMGRGLPYGWSDIRFCWLAAAALFLYGALYYAGLRKGGMQLLAIGPFLAAAAAYLVFMALRSRRHSGTDVMRRKEYRLGVMVVVVLAGGLVVMRQWAFGQGIDMGVFNGVAVMTLGLVFVAATLLPFTVAVAYRRASMLLSAAMLLFMGWVVFSLDGIAQHLWLVGTGVMAFVGNAVLMIHFKRRDEAEPSDAA